MLNRVMLKIIQEKSEERIDPLINTNEHEEENVNREPETVKKLDSSLRWNEGRKE